MSALAGNAFAVGTAGYCGWGLWLLWRDYKRDVARIRLMRAVEYADARARVQALLDQMDGFPTRTEMATAHDNLKRKRSCHNRGCDGYGKHKCHDQNCKSHPQTKWTPYEGWRK